MPDAPLNLRPGKHYSMADAAAHDMVISITCRPCRKTINYLATDLVKVVGPTHPVVRAPWRCRKCGAQEWLEVKWEMRTAHLPKPGLIIRRPVGQVMRWIWRNETID